MHGGIGTPRAPLLGPFGKPPAGVQCRKGVPEAEIADREGVRVTEGAPVSAGSAPPSRSMSPAATAVARARSVRRRCPVSPSPLKSASATCAAVGNRWVSPPGVAAARGMPQRATRRPARVLAAATETCCPSTARMASSNPS